jgi:hypothetical protein
LAYDKNDHPIKELVLEFYNELESTIGDPPDGIFFTFSTKVTNYNKHNRNKQVIRELIASVKWNERSIIIDEYINKLKKLFPTWNFS